MIIAVNFLIQAIGKKKPEKKNQGFNGIRTRDLRVKKNKITAMIILHSHLQPQFINELFHILHINESCILLNYFRKTLL